MVLSILITIAVLLVTAYKLFTRNHDYWQKRSVPHATPVAFFGNFFEVFANRVYIGHFLQKYCNKFDTPYFGLYIMNIPILVVRSPELLKQILIKDFRYFCDHNVLGDEKLDPLASKMLFFSKNPKWKHARSKMSAAFGITKVKAAMPLLERAAEKMKLYIYDNVGKPLEAKELCIKYFVEFIAPFSFGVDAHCFKNEKDEYKIIGCKMFHSDVITMLRQICYIFAPKIVKLLKLSFFDRDVRHFAKQVVLSSVGTRKEDKIRKNDVIDTIIDIQKKSGIDDPFNVDEDLVVAQVTQFLGGGLDTTSGTISYTLYELCFQPDLQDRVRSEIKNVAFEHGGINYEALQGMKFLDMVIYETLRKYPVVPFLNRICMEDYKIPNSNVVIEKGTPIFIPMFGFHYNPEYFPDPEKYDPERFSSENRRNLTDCCYIPFGDGPRRCIGEKYGMMIVKVALAHLLSEFKLVKAENTPLPPSFMTNCVFLLPDGGLPFKFKPLTD